LRKKEIRGSSEGAGGFVLSLGLGEVFEECLTIVRKADAGKLV